MSTGEENKDFENNWWATEGLQEGGEGAGLCGTQYERMIISWISEFLKVKRLQSGVPGPRDKRHTNRRCHAATLESGQ